MTKDGPDVLNYPPGDPTAPTVAYGYYPGPQITDAAEQQYALLAQEHHLVGLLPDRFVERLADHWGEINTGGSTLIQSELFVETQSSF